MGIWKVCPKKKSKLSRVATKSRNPEKVMETNFQSGISGEKIDSSTIQGK